MAKMDESVIAEQFSRYLQRVTIAATSNKKGGRKVIDQEDFLNYYEFKEYYILTLIGKGDKEYLNKLVSKIQHKNLAI